VVPFDVPSTSNGAQTVARALAVLGCFRGPSELGLSEIARQLGLPTSTVHRLLRSLVDAGFLDQDPDSSRYRLGGTLAEFGQIAYRQHRIYLAEPHLERLATATGATSSIAVRHGNDAVMLGFSRWREANGHELQGIRLPLHASALGKALLAWSDTSDEELARLDLAPATDRTVTTVEALQAELTRTCERGYALNDEELVTGFRTIGVPILDRTGRAAFALGLRGPIDLMASDRIPAFAGLALAAAEDVRLTLFPADA
jgi:IclR family acetate operon transcriptional repressor